MGWPSRDINDDKDTLLISVNYGDSKLQLRDLQEYAETIKARLRQNSPKSEDLETCLELCEASIEERQMQHKRAELQMKRSAGPAIVKAVSDSESMLAERASISKAIVAAAQGRQLTGAEAELDREGRAQHPHSSASIQLPTWYTRATGNFGKDSSVSDIANAVTGQQTLAARVQGARHAEPTAVQLGALVVNASGSASYLVPYLGRTAAAEANEGAATTSTADFQQTTLTPRRFTRRLSISQLGLSVGAGGMDDIIANDLRAAHAAAIDKVAFDAVRAGATFQSKTLTGAASDEYPATTLADLFALVQSYQTAAQSNGVPSLVCSPEAFEDLNSIENSNITSTLAQAFSQATGASVRPIVNMVDADFAANVISNGTAGQTIAGAGFAVAADFSDVVIAQFGGPAILVDMYTASSQDIVTFHANQYCDAGLIRSSVQALATADANITAT
jgi:HK97 family phage major capsid protein